MKMIFVTGGVISSLGKGIFSASLGHLLKTCGHRVAIMKLDPYINVDPGTMSPFQHGEVFVTEDGAETDLDIGHYERFLDESLSGRHSLTAGKVYQSVIARERRGDYLGATVQVIPHVTNEIKQRIRDAREANQSDVLLVEVGGTVGDIESLPFLEAIRQLASELGRGHAMFVHLTLVPYFGAAGELKTKPTQHSVQKLREIGISPDVLVCRSERSLSRDVKDKIALFSGLSPQRVVESVNSRSIYAVPEDLKKQGILQMVEEVLGVQTRTCEESFLSRVAGEEFPHGSIRIAMVGKYVELKDAYLSVTEALMHAGVAEGVRVEVLWVDSAEEEHPDLSQMHGVLVPGGFGVRGIEGKLNCIRIARDGRIPFFGICLGLQCAVIEFARNCAGLQKAHSREFDPDCREPVIDFMTDQLSILNKGGTMRLGVWPCKIAPRTKAHQAYQKPEIQERHRHRFEVNPHYHSLLQEHGLVFSGLSPDERLVEILELSDHPWFVASQFHPEFCSRPHRPHPLFHGFIRAAKARKDELIKESK